MVFLSNLEKKYVFFVSHSPSPSYDQAKNKEERRRKKAEKNSGENQRRKSEAQLGKEGEEHRKKRRRREDKKRQNQDDKKFSTNKGLKFCSTFGDWLKGFAVETKTPCLN